MPGSRRAWRCTPSPGPSASCPPPFGGLCHAMHEDGCARGDPVAVVVAVRMPLHGRGWCRGYRWSAGRRRPPGVAPRYRLRGRPRTAVESAPARAAPRRPPGPACRAESLGIRPIEGESSHACRPSARADRCCAERQSSHTRRSGPSAAPHVMGMTTQLERAPAPIGRTHRGHD